MNKKGFTLTELLMVVVILGILGGIALPRFFPQKEKAYVTEAIGMLSAIRQSLEAYRTEYGVYCSAGGGIGTACHASAPWTMIGLDDPNGFANRAWNYKVDSLAVGTVANSSYQITATRINNYGADANAGKTVILARDGTYSGDHPNRPA
jgi:prepilin-type N-terminal cleavage/methylation domain-containing protein